jgi:hypothetical protein
MKVYPITPVLILWLPHGGDPREAAARVLLDPDVGPFIYSAHLSAGSRGEFVVHVPDVTGDEAADRKRVERSFAAAARGVSIEDLDAVMQAERVARRRAITDRHAQPD